MQELLADPRIDTLRQNGYTFELMDEKVRRTLYGSEADQNREPRILIAFEETKVFGMALYREPRRARKDKQQMYTMITKRSQGELHMTAGLFGYKKEMKEVPKNNIDALVIEIKRVHGEVRERTIRK